MRDFPSKEYGLIERLRGVLPRVDQPSYDTTIGDDAAIRISKAGERLIITADISVENVHFSVDMMTMEEIGYKAMVSNLSDCAAMGARADSAVVQLVFPKKNNNNHHNNNNNNGDNNNSVEKSIEKIYAGFTKACERWNFPIVGGDLSGGDNWVIGITLIGAVCSDERIVKRTGIVDGDVLWVTGMPGRSAAGLACLRKWGRSDVPQKYQQLVDAHISPIPRIDEGRMFAANQSVHAMMDLSDGLSKDVATLCWENGLGFVFGDGGYPRNAPPKTQYAKTHMLKPLCGQKFPFGNFSMLKSTKMTELAEELKCDWKEWFYHGGEEYELLIACEPSYHPSGCIRLGQFTSQHRDMFFVDDDNTLKKLLPKGWDHCS